MVAVEAVSRWGEALEALAERIGGLVAKPEPRRRVRAYLEGLLERAERAVVEPTDAGECVVRFARRRGVRAGTRSSGPASPTRCFGRLEAVPAIRPQSLARAGRAAEIACLPEGPTKQPIFPESA